MLKNSDMLHIVKVIALSCLLFIAKTGSAQTYQNGPDLTQTKSGLKYKITKHGAGEFPKPGDRVWVHYYAKFRNDSIYESTVETGPVDFYLGQGQLIKGWEEGLRLIKPGGAILLVVPPELGYGNAAFKNIPPNSTLIFEIALLQVNAGKTIEPFVVEGLPVQKASKKLKYYIVAKGNGDYAKPGDNAFVHYTAFLPDGTIFDSSHKKGEPVSIIVGANQVIKGWDMGLELMNQGSKIKLIIPPKLAYGPAGYKNIVPPKTAITLDLELVDLAHPKPVEKWDTTGKKVIETVTGLKYVVFDAGSGDFIVDENIVVAHYSGYFTNGDMFDSSVKRFEPLRFPVGVGAVVAGWDEGLKLMKKGARFQFIIPSPLAYGAKGVPLQIPPYADLIFDIEVLDVIK